MADVLTRSQRRLNMSRIRARDTKPELIVRKALHSRGFRYRLHVRTLPGRPDLVLPKYRAIVFVHGCFWHGHDCKLFKWPQTREQFWRSKISANRLRDQSALETLNRLGWRTLVIWECALRGPDRQSEPRFMRIVTAFLAGRSPTREIGADA